MKLMSGKDYWRRWVRRLGGGPWEQYRFYQDMVVVEGFSTPDAGSSKSPRKGKGKTKAPPESVARVQGVLPGDIVDKVDKYKLQGEWRSAPPPAAQCTRWLHSPSFLNAFVLGTATATRTRAGIELRNVMKLIKNLPRPLSIRFRRPTLRPPKAAPLADGVDEKGGDAQAVRC